MVTPASQTPLEPQLDDQAPDKRLRFADSYGLVLVLLVLSFFASAVAGDNHYGRLTTLVLLAATAWLALRASQVERRLLRWAETLIPLATLAAIVASVLGSDDTARIVTASLTALLVLVAPAAIIKRVATHPVINLNTFYGAVCVYLLIAMFFASCFAVIGAASGQGFFAQIQPPAKASSTDYLYFSFVTITTVGYGDLTARGDVGRMTAVLEAIFGQLYLITVVALVVQNLGLARKRKLLEEEERGPPEA
ncbi:MAG TPA: ion channel [Thermoleophilia bacterium]|nr:ion channel [Thermoleophilia bacterium]